MRISAYRGFVRFFLQVTFKQPQSVLFRWQESGKVGTGGRLGGNHCQHKRRQESKKGPHGRLTHRKTVHLGDAAEKASFPKEQGFFSGYKWTEVKSKNDHPKQGCLPLYVSSTTKLAVSNQACSHPRKTSVSVTWNRSICYSPAAFLLSFAIAYGENREVLLNLCVTILITHVIINCNLFLFTRLQ